jgi:hypothetical protein
MTLAGKAPAEINKTLAGEAKKADNKAARHGGGAAGGTAAGGGTASQTDWSQITIEAIVAIVFAAILVIFFLYWHRNHRARAAAYQAVAQLTPGG